MNKTIKEIQTMTSTTRLYDEVFVHVSTFYVMENFITFHHSRSNHGHNTWAVLGTGKLLEGKAALDFIKSYMSTK